VPTRQAKLSFNDYQPSEEEIANMGIMGKKRKRIDLDPIDVANEKNLEDFERSYMPDG
jgi:hypothetical protein